MHKLELAIPLCSIGSRLCETLASSMMREKEVILAMKIINLLSLLALSFGLVLVVVQNTGPVQAHFLWFTAEVPAILLLFLTGTGVFVSGLFIALFVRSGAKSKP